MSIVAGVDFGTLSGADVPMALAALSASSATSAPSGSDFDFYFSQRLSVSAVKILSRNYSMSIVAGVDFGTLSGADVPMALAALSASSATSAPSGSDFDFSFSQRLSVSAVKILSRNYSL